MQTQLYGSFADFGSFSNVSRAIEAALRRERIQVAIYEIATLFPNYQRVKAPVEVDSHAPVGICVAYPPQGVGWLQGHDIKILFTVCESDRIPADWVRACRDIDQIIVPSKFCFDAFRRSGVTRPIEIIHHGVEVYCRSTYATQRESASRIYSDAQQESASQSDRHSPRDTRRAHAIRFLHVSGAVSFPQRKGTTTLLAAFARFTKQYPDATLWLKMPQTRSLDEVIDKLHITSNVAYVQPRETLPPEKMLAIYQGVDAVVQPSRGEGFGLVPLESRCVGVPTILTRATGHAEHFQRSCDVEIDIYADAPIKTQGNEEGVAPSISVDGVYRALCDFAENREAWTRRAQTWAGTHAAEWTWPKILAPFARQIAKTVHDDPPRGMIAGEDASLRGL